MSDALTYFGMFSCMVKTLYRSSESGARRRGDRSPGDRSRPALDSLARTVSRCFGHRAQRLALQAYGHSVFSDSERKSMQAMLARVTDPITYQGFQHFITHAVWDADRIWRRLLEVLPERLSMLSMFSSQEECGGDVCASRDRPGALVESCDPSTNSAFDHEART